MPLVTSGQISLNDMHVEVGGTSATECSLNDADIRGLIGKSSAAQSGFNEFYGASSTSYIVLAPAAGTYTTFDDGDFRYYVFSGATNTAPNLTSLGDSGSNGEKLYFRMWGAGGGGGGGGQYAGADGGAGGYSSGYWIPTATGLLRIQVGSGGQGGENMNNGYPVIDGGAGGQPSGISSTNLEGGAGGAGYGADSSSEVGGGGGGGGGTRFRTNWSTGSPASPTFEVWVGAGGGGGGSDQSASGAPTAGGSGGAGSTSNSTGLDASTIGNSGGGGGATSSTGGTGGVVSGNGQSGQAGVLYHGGDGGTGPSNSYGGGGGGGAGYYGGGGGGTGGSSQAAGGGGGSGSNSGSVTLTAALRRSYGNRNAVQSNAVGFVSGASAGGLKGPQTLGAPATTRAGTGGSGCVVLYHKFQN